MPFPDNILTEDETVIRQFRPHWRLLAIPVLWLIAGVVAIVLVYQKFPPKNGTADLITTAAIVVALVFLTGAPFVRWWFTHYVLTTERLMTRTGVLSRSGIELPLANINDVVFHQNALERILKSGDLMIESAGESGQSRFSDIPNPEEFQALLYRTREERARRISVEESAIAAEAGRDPTEQLERAARLHAEGVLSDEEFAAMKRSILEGD